MVAVGLDIEGGLDARPLAAKLRVGFDGEFVLCIFGLRFDQIFVGAFLNLELVVGHRSADDIIWRFGQQVNEQPVPGIQAFSLFQSRQTILQHVLDIKRPECGGDEHPLI